MLYKYVAAIDKNRINGTDGEFSVISADMIKAKLKLCEGVGLCKVDSA